MRNLLLLLLTAIFGMSTPYAVAHTGETDDAGCHTNDDTGVYHCH